MVQRLTYKSSLNKYTVQIKRLIMKNFYRNLLLSIVMIFASVVGWVKGTEAKQKLVYKWKTSYDEKRQLARKRMALRKGQVVLDDVEWAAFHNS
jgi:hypothetical protein